MKSNIGEISVSRLRRVLAIDRNLNVPERLTDLVRGEITPILENYFMLSDIEIDLKHDEEKYVMQITVYADSIKMLNLTMLGGRGG